ncbi:MAG TPA: hypothetical protein VH482_16970 [Thermomicrobiales bacterium]|jgi:hypothetical protein
MRWVVGFGRFWWDFIVGDSPVLAVGAAAVLVVNALLVATGADEIVQVVLPLTVAVTLAFSVRR